MIEFCHRKANSLTPMSDMDGELVSMVVLQQLNLLVRRFPGGCFLSGTVLAQAQTGISEADIR